MDFKERFKNHKIISHQLYGYSIGIPTIEHLVWGKPGTIINRIYYMLHRQSGLLCVYGDLYDAVYQWYGPDLTLEWIANCNLDYFHQKCKASQNGASYKNYDWDSELAERTIVEYFKEYDDCDRYKNYMDSYLRRVIDNKENFIAELYNIDGIEMFGEDFWEWVPTSGNTIPWTTKAHLAGLKIAFGIDIKY